MQLTPSLPSPRSRTIRLLSDSACTRRRGQPEMSVFSIESARIVNRITSYTPACVTERRTPTLRQHCNGYRVWPTQLPPPACTSYKVQQQTSRRIAQRTCSRRRRSALAAAGIAPGGSGDDWDRPPNEKEAALLLRSTQAESQPQVGAEYGEVSDIKIRRTGYTR